MAAQLDLRLPVIVYNGAFLVDPVAGDRIHSSFLDPALTDGILALCRAHEMPPLVYRIEDDTDRVSWVAGEESDGIREYLVDRGGDSRFAPVAQWSDLSARAPFYVSVIGDSDPIGELAAEVRELAGARVTINVQNDTYHPQRTWLELTAPNANKAAAVTWLGASVGARHVVAFGDNVNDLPMFRVADHTVAVGNAVDELKQVAHEVALSNDDHGVARWLQARASRRVGSPPQ